MHEFENETSCKDRNEFRASFLWNIAGFITIYTSASRRRVYQAVCISANKSYVVNFRNGHVFTHDWSKEKIEPRFQQYRTEIGNILDTKRIKIPDWGGGNDKNFLWEHKTIFNLTIDTWKVDYIWNFYVEYEFERKVMKAFYRVCNYLWFVATMRFLRWVVFEVQNLDVRPDFVS